VGRKELGKLCLAVSSSEFNKRLMSEPHAKEILASSLCNGAIEMDHIIPQSRGGADHPTNYIPVCSKINTSFGNKFNLAKCFLVGAEACAVAVKCSGLFGGNHGKSGGNFVRFDNGTASQVLQKLMDAASVGFRLKLKKAVAKAKTDCTFAGERMNLRNWPAHTALLKRHLVGNEAMASLLKKFTGTGAAHITQHICIEKGACPAGSMADDLLSYSKLGVKEEL
jgi:hypothetical protein